MTEQTAMRMALEALEKSRIRIVEQGGSGWKLEAQRCVNAITALRQALEQQQDEPVALRETLNRFLADKGVYLSRESIDDFMQRLNTSPQPATKAIAELKTVNEPCNQVMALGQMLREWLQEQVSDAGTSVDIGKGFSEFDLWVQCEGKELFITIKEKND